MQSPIKKYQLSQNFNLVKGVQYNENLSERKGINPFRKINSSIKHRNLVISHDDGSYSQFQKDEDVNVE